MHTNKKHHETCDKGEQNSRILQQRLGVFHHSNRRICFPFFGFFFSRSVIVHHNEIAEHMSCFSCFYACFYPCHCLSCGHYFCLCKRSKDAPSPLHWNWRSQSKFFEKEEFCRFFSLLKAPSLFVGLTNRDVFCCCWKYLFQIERKSCCIKLQQLLSLPSK